MYKDDNSRALRFGSCTISFFFLPYTTPPPPPPQVVSSAIVNMIFHKVKSDTRNKRTYIMYPLETAKGTLRILPEFSARKHYKRNGLCKTQTVYPYGIYTIKIVFIEMEK